MITIVQLFRWIFFTIDQVVFWLAEMSYRMLLSLSGATSDDPIEIISSSTIEDISKRIYGFLLIFLVFKISIEALKYISNPDNLTKAEGGAISLFKRIIITIVLIIILPISFDLGRRIQTEILAEGVIISMVFTPNEEQDSKIPFMYTDNINNIATELTFVTFTAFFTPICEDYGDDPLFENATPSECEGKKIMDEYNEDFHQKRVVEGNKNATRKIYHLTKYIAKTQKIDGEKVFVFDYAILASTIVGGLIAWTLMLFTLDIGIRMVKLAFLEIIHPIIIMSYLSPKSNVFKNWIKEYLSNYMIVFIRIFVLFLGILILAEIGKNNDLKDNGLMGVFIIISVFMAMKQIPKMAQKIFNIKTSFSFNPLTRIEQAPIIGKPISRAASVAGVAGTMALGAGVGGALKAGGSAIKATAFKEIVNKQTGKKVIDKKTGQNPTWKNRYKQFKEGTFESKMSKDFKETKEEAGKTKIGLGLRKASAVARSANQGDKAPTLTKLLETYGKIDPNSRHARRQTEKRAKDNSLISDLKNVFEDSIMVKHNLQIKTSVVMDDNGNLLYNPDGTVMNSNVPLQAKDINKRENLLPKVMNRLDIERDKQNSVLINLNNEKDDINISDNTVNTFSELNNVGVSQTEANDSNFYSQLNANLQTAYNNNDTALFDSINAKIRAIDEFKKVDITEINNYNKKEQIKVDIKKTQAEISRIDNSKEAVQRDIENIDTTKFKVGKIKAADKDK